MIRRREANKTERKEATAAGAAAERRRVEAALDCVVCCSLRVLVDSSEVAWLHARVDCAWSPFLTPAVFDNVARCEHSGTAEAKQTESGAVDKVCLKPDSNNQQGTIPLSGTSKQTKSRKGRESRAEERKGGWELLPFVALSRKISKSCVLHVSCFSNRQCAGGQAEVRIPQACVARRAPLACIAAAVPLTPVPPAGALEHCSM